MSLEALLLLAFLLLLPLIERLVRSARRRQEGTRVRSEARPIPTSSAAVRVTQSKGAQSHHAPAGAPLPAYVPEMASIEEAPVHSLTQDASRRTSYASERRRRRPPGAVLGGPPDLRRAVVLMTVLEPCRALEIREVSANREARRVAR
jgi:hypothetical protein